MAVNVDCYYEAAVVEMVAGDVIEFGVAADFVDARNPDIVDYLLFIC